MRTLRFTLLAHSLISTSGIAGMSPAAKLVRLMSSRSRVEAHRHVELEARGDRRARRRDRAGAKVTSPVVGSQLQSSPSSSSTPSTATSTVPATGLRIVARIGRVRAAIGLDELERRRRAVAGADRLVGRPPASPPARRT